MTLTLAPEDWQTRRQKVRDFTRAIRRDGYDWEMGWATELNPKLTGFHIHGVQHGSYVPQNVLQERWGSIVDIRGLKRPGAGIYAVKEALRVAGYVVKGGTEDASGLAGHLARNGGRAAHLTRGFLHGETTRTVLNRVREQLAEGERLTWVLVPAHAIA